MLLLPETHCLQLIHSPVNKVSTWSPSPNSVTPWPTLSTILQASGKEKKIHPDASWPKIRGKSWGGACRDKMDAESVRIPKTQLLSIRKKTHFSKPKSSASQQLTEKVPQLLLRGRNLREPSGEVTAAKRSGDDLNADLHGLRRAELHLFNRQWLAGSPRHRRPALDHTGRRHSFAPVVVACLRPDVVYSTTLYSNYPTNPLIFEMDEDVLVVGYLYDNLYCRPRLC
ncbi:UDP-Glycosyltransferase superfamily protein [Striga asiatica]|uniref:UDP-Glycosyltransferase superfamily protein n=1 Tax=Striga asiatica TaxID=4170 RepID=A0A5A7RHM2_STRAF|nr:UDP-Glycosyltransferase superfamily protein [Striga asiatica]